mgnify:CR=1 FL=1
MNEILTEFGKALFGNVVYRNCEYGVFIGSIFLNSVLYIISGYGDIQVFCFTGFHTDDLRHRIL